MLIVDPATSPPGPTSTGTDSPVSIERSIAELPSSATPSVAIFSPGRTTNRSPRLGNYYCCPWSPIYTTVHPTTIGSTPRPGQQFAFDVSAEELTRGGRFKRALLLGDFSPTD